MDNICCGCFETLSDSQLIKCTECGGQFHLQCVNVLQNEYQHIALNWICPTCKGKVPKSDNTNRSVRTSTPTLDDTINVNTKPRSRVATSKPKIVTSDSDSNALKSLTNEIRLMRNDMSQIKSQLNELAVCIKTCNNRLDGFDERITQTEHKISYIECQAKERIRELNDTVSQLRDEINAQTQAAICNEIEIMGISESKHENLKHTILLTASKIGVDLKEDDVDWATRTGIVQKRISGDTIAKMPRPIIVRLLRRSKRDELIKAAKTRKNLNCKDIVSDGLPGKVYINEHLTKQNRQLFRETRTKAHTKGFKFCWIRNGQILLRKEEGMPATRIQNMAHIHQILGPDTPDNSSDQGLQPKLPAVSDK